MDGTHPWLDSKYFKYEPYEDQAESRRPRTFRKLAPFTRLSHMTVVERQPSMKTGKRGIYDISYRQARIVLKLERFELPFSSKHESYSLLRDL